MARKDNVDLICSIGELAGLFEKSSSLSDFLHTVVSIVAYHMRAAVCSVYLLDTEREELVLRANQGLNPESVGRLRLGLGEGLVGLALKELRPIREASARSHPLFKFIPGINEEAYEAFLAVPIVRGLERIGVLVVQDSQRDYFDEHDQKALQAIASQLATVIENAKLLMSLHAAPEPRGEPAGREAPLPQLVKGITGCPGVRLARSVHMEASADTFTLDRSTETLRRTREDFERAVADTEEQLQAMQRDMEERLEDVASLIFAAHLLIIKDEEFTGSMRRQIEFGRSPQVAVASVVNHYVQLFSGSTSPKLRDMVSDVKDLGHRILHNLIGEDDRIIDYADKIVITRELLPSEVLKLVAEKVAGFVLVSAGVSSHIVIMCRSLQIPMVAARHEALLQIPDGTELLIDGEQANVFIAPEAAVRRQYEDLLRLPAAAAEAPDVHPETWTSDGHRVHLLANINLLSEIEVALQYQAEGVGLYRSEFPFIVRNQFPSEEEQWRIYRTILERMGDREVTFRTLDVGGDKILAYAPVQNESNPFLGLRALRFSLRYPDIFTLQLRAMLRAGRGRPELRIMFPLVSSVDEFLEARRVVRSCEEALRQEGLDDLPRTCLGIMVELPSVVGVIEEMAQHAEFLSLGTNDLVQYTLGVDRNNEHVSDLYVNHHPAVLRSLKRVADAARDYDRDLSICGEMATDPKLIAFLLGIGIRKFSMFSRQLPRIQKMIEAISLEDAEAHAARVLSFGTVREVEDYLSGRIREGGRS